MCEDCEIGDIAGVERLIEWFGERPASMTQKSWKYNLSEMVVHMSWFMRGKLITNEWMTMAIVSKIITLLSIFVSKK